MEIRVREIRLPGLGMRYELELGGGRRLFVVAERGGKRDLGMHGSGESPEWQVELHQEEAVMLASLLLGARFTLDTSADESVVGDAVVVDTVELPAGSPAVGLTAAEIRISDPGATVLAVICDETPDLVEDDASYRCRPGDRVVVAARAPQIDRALGYLRGDAA